MPDSRQRLGALGEQAATDALIARGYEIVERNWRRGGGEIDIVARDGETWVFVEVKARRERGPEGALDTLRPAKLARLNRLAAQYLVEQDRVGVNWRLDWVGVEVDSRGGVKVIQLLQGIGADV